MPRIEKGTRVKSLPPKVQLLQKNSLFYPKNTLMIGSGSYPFNETKAVRLNVIGNLAFPTGLPTNSPYLENNNVTSSLQTTGKTNSFVFDSFLQPKEQETLNKPFVDFLIPEADAMKDCSASFYATGSKLEDVGEGFGQPLWSKTKITIDITPSEEHSFGIVNFLSTSSNFVMAYWNKNTRKYEGIGNGNEFDKYSGVSDIGGLVSFLNEKAIGFGSSLDNGGILGTIASASFLIGNPISNFGFPSTALYEATSSNTILMKDYISEPFLVEKMVLYFSGALDHHNYFADSRGSLTTFFVLNQRQGFANKVQRTITYNSGTDAGLQRTITNSEQMGTIRDLVSWVQISKIPHSGKAEYDLGLSREYDYDSAGFNQQLIVSGVIKSPLEYSQGQMVAIASVDDTTRNTPEYIENLEVSGRNLLGDRGRSFVNPWQTSPTYGAITLQSILPTISSINTYAKAKYHKPNPYLLLPTDKLVFGFQVPYSSWPFNQFFSDQPTYDGVGPTLTASATGIHKVVFYGSLLKNNKEHHDTFETSTEQELFSVKMG